MSNPPLEATSLLAAFSQGRLSPVEVATSLLASAEDAGVRYRHILAIDHDGVLNAARDSEVRWREGRARLLEGLPFALKGMIPPDDDLVARVTAQGAYLQCAVVPGGLGTPVRYSLGEAPLNPRDLRRIPGGSSTGSAIALAAGHVPLAIGSDAAGSIRIPAACCQVVGLKPTRGRLPKPSGMGLSHTLGEAGPMARTPEDVALLFAALAQTAVPDTTTKLESHSAVVALHESVNAETALGLKSVVSAIRSQGTKVSYAELPLVSAARAAGWTVLCYEAARSLAPHLAAIRRAPTTFLKYAERGGSIADSEYDAAIATGERFAAAVDDILGDADVMITPCSPWELPRTADPTLGKKVPKVGEMFLPFSLSGHPALVLSGPAFQGARTSIQLVGRKGGDWELLGLGTAIWHHTAFQRG